MSEGTLFGLIHDLKDRSRAKQIRQAQANYVTNPSEETMKAVQALDYDTGYKMLTNQQAFDENKQVLEKGQNELEAGEADRYVSALRNVGQGLVRTRDSGGDVLGTFDSMTPVFKSGFRMSDEEINTWRGAIAENPSVLDQLATFTTEPAKPLSQMNIGPGSVVWDPNTNTAVFRNPAATKFQKLKGPDGNESLYAVDEQGNILEGGPSPAPAQLGIDPQARGMRNNNPGNIKDGPWARRQPGYAGSDGTFARFNSLEQGTAAQESLLGNHYVNGQRSVQDIVLKYLGGANNPENSTESQRNYVGYVASRLGINPGDPVPPAALPQLAQAMREFENGTRSGGKGGPIAQTTGTSGWKQLSTEEAAARGLPTDTQWQIGLDGKNKGKVVPITGTAPRSAGRGKGKDGPQLTVAAHERAVRSLADIRDQARSLRTHKAFDQATGSIDGLLPSIFPGSVDFDKKLDTFVGSTVVRGLLEMKQNSPNGATGFGAMNQTEGSWLRDSQGTFNRRAPESLRGALQKHETDAMISIGLAYGVPPKATAYLLQHPDTAAQFEAKFGKGLANIIRGN